MLQPPEPTPLDILELSDGKDNLDKLVGTYSLSKPHPGYGKDPNIINQLGHTIYPKMVYPAGVDAPGVIVNSHEHEVQVMGDKAAPSPEAAKGAKPGNDW